MTKEPISRRTFRDKAYAALVLVGLIAIVAATAQHAGARTLANHCTHYTPTYAQDTSGGCSELGNVAATSYGTQSTALRDDNTSASSNSQTMCVFYYISNISTWDDSYCGTGTSIDIARASSGYRYSGCVFDQADALGVCMTTWHS
jgi:hypothetical protein